jgi:PAS domain S-box-containing protein
MPHIDRDSEISYSNLFKKMTQGVVYQNAEGKIISANPSAEKILGLTFDQMTGRTSMDPRWKTIHEDGSDFSGEDHPAMTALITGERVEGVIMGVFNPEKEAYRWININAIPEYRESERKPYRVYTTFDDITERRHAEAERENLISELRKALKEVKTLRGILPLCSFCKKIRDDKGYWEQVDIYLHKHSLADISHSVCPKCAKEHYPDLDINED